MKHQSVCCCEGILEMWLTFTIILQEGKFPLIMSEGLVQSVASLRSKNWGLLKKKKFCLKAAVYASSFPASSCLPQQIHTPVLITSLCVCVHIGPVLFLWRYLPDRFFSLTIIFLRLIYVVACILLSNILLYEYIMAYYFSCWWTPGLILGFSQLWIKLL